MRASAALQFVARVHFAGLWVGSTPLTWPTVVHDVSAIDSPDQRADLLAYPDATLLASRMFRESVSSPAGFGLELLVGFEAPEEVELIRERCMPWKREEITKVA